MKPILKGTMRLERTGRSPDKNPKDLDKFNQNFNPDGAALNYYQTKPFTEAPGLLLQQLNSKTINQSILQTYESHQYIGDPHEFLSQTPEPPNIESMI